MDINSPKVIGNTPYLCRAASKQQQQSSSVLPFRDHTASREWLGPRRQGCRIWIPLRWVSCVPILRRRGLIRRDASRRWD